MNFAEKNSLKNRAKTLLVKVIDNKKWLLLLFILHSSVFMSGCGVYSFTGTNLSPDIKTFRCLISQWAQPEGLPICRKGLLSS